MNKYINRNRKSRKFEEKETNRQRLCRLVDQGSVSVEDALVTCVAAMSEEDCENVLCQLADAALEGECPSCDDDDMSVGIDDTDNDMESDEVSVDSDLPDDEDEINLDVEACKKESLLRKRISRLERLVKSRNK